MKMPSFAGLFDWFKREDSDEEFRESYRKLLVGQYVSMPPTVNAPEAKSEGDRIAQLPPEKMTWEELYQLELVILKLEPLDSLKRRLWTLRNEYRELASPEEVRDYDASSPPQIEQASEAELRADAVRLQEELNWRYVTVWVFEGFRGNIIKRLSLTTAGLLLFALLLVCSWESISNWDWVVGAGVNLPFLAMILIPGILGGLVSTLNRVQRARLKGNADAGLTELQQAKFGIYISPLLGGVFALLLFFLFAGGFITGSLFPEVSFDNLGSAEPPKGDLAQLSRLVVWSFIAGFAEKFVPDRLQQFTQEDKGGKPPVE